MSELAQPLGSLGQFPVAVRDLKPLVTCARVFGLGGQFLGLFGLELVAFHSRSGSASRRLCKNFVAKRPPAKR